MAIQRRGAMRMKFHNEAPASVGAQKGPQLVKAPHRTARCSRARAKAGVSAFAAPQPRQRARRRVLAGALWAGPRATTRRREPQPRSPGNVYRTRQLRSRADLAGALEAAGR